MQHTILYTVWIILYYILKCYKRKIIQTKEDVDDQRTTGPRITSTQIFIKSYWESYHEPWAYEKYPCIKERRKGIEKSYFIAKKEFREKSWARDKKLNWKISFVESYIMMLTNSPLLYTWIGIGLNCNIISMRVRILSFDFVSTQTNFCNPKHFIT